MEYALFGDGYVRRESVDHEWESVSREDVPDAEIARLLMPQFRREQIAQGQHPDGGVQFARFVHRAPR